MTALMSLVIGVVGWRLASWSFSCVILPALVLSFLQPITVVYVNTILLLWGHEVLYKIVDRNSFYAKVLRHPVLYYTCHAVTYFACGISYTSPRLVAEGVALSQLLLGIDLYCSIWVIFTLFLFGGCICTLQLAITEYVAEISADNNKKKSVLKTLVTNFSVEIRILVALMVSTWACARGTSHGKRLADILRKRTENGTVSNITWQRLLSIELGAWIGMSLLLWVLLGMFVSVCRVAANKSYILNVEPKTKNMKIRSKEIRHPAREPVRNAFRKLRGARSLYVVFSRLSSPSLISQENLYKHQRFSNTDTIKPRNSSMRNLR